jgi:RNA polymerase sigma-70 factor, ECF subfamily
VPHYRADKAIEKVREGQHSGHSGGVVTDANVNQGGEAGTTSLSLLERARARDQAAWSRLVDLYGPLLHRWCLGAGLQPADAADVTQEVFAVVARSIDGFRHDRPGDTFRGWLYSITRNKIRDRLRKAETPGIGGTDAQRRLASVPAEDADPEPPADPEGERALYMQAIEMIRGEFEPMSWQAFWKVTVDGRSAADVAAELGMSRNAVYLARSRILGRLREEFNGLVNPDAGAAASARPEETGQ